MKRLHLLIWILLLATPVLGQAQNKKSDSFKAYKTAYITEKLDLTPAEAEKFWPIYNQYNREMRALKSNHYKKDIKHIKESGGIDALSEKEANMYMQKNLTYEQDVVSLKQSFYNNLKGVISVHKILKLQRAEHEFGRRLLHEYKRKHKNASSN